VVVMVLVSRECRAFAPVGEKVANPKRRSQGWSEQHPALAR